jgi:hypothetical protein
MVLFSGIMNLPALKGGELNPERLNDRPRRTLDRKTPKEVLCGLR